MRSQCSADQNKTLKKPLCREERHGAGFLFSIVCLLSYLKDLAVLSSCQDPVGSPADAANRQTWRRKRRNGRRRRIRSAVKKKKKLSKNLEKQQKSCNKKTTGFKMTRHKNKKEEEERKKEMKSRRWRKYGVKGRNRNG